MTRSTPRTPPLRTVRDFGKRVHHVVRRSPRKLAVGVNKKQIVGTAKKKKVSTNIVTCNMNKVQPNVGRSGSSSRDVPSKKKQKGKASKPELEVVEEDKLDDDDDDEHEGGADDDEKDDDGDDDAEEYKEEDEGSSDDEGEVEAGDNPFVESEQEDEDDSSDDEVIQKTRSDGRGGTTHHSFSKRKLNKRTKQNRIIAMKPRLTSVGADPTDCQTARKSATPAAESSEMDIGQIKLVHAYTRKESANLREEHVATRVRSFVKNVMFRTIKFVNSEAMIDRAMETLYKFENVKEHKKLEFHRLYESVFNDALNTKRSACEQAGGKIVKDMLTMTDPDELFTVEELCKLRRSITEREKQAFYWFFSTFIECVCGKKAWGKLKYTSLVSKATLSNATPGKKVKYTACFLISALTNNAIPGKIVTISDEAFALLLYENYISKWIEIAAENRNEEEGTPEVGRDQRNKKKAEQRRRGKYTGAEAKTGQCKFGGWSQKGMKRFNTLYALVKEDRASPQAAEMERKLLEFCNSNRQSTDGDVAIAASGLDGEAAARMLSNFEPPVEAMWDDIEEL
jgi:hypothetical protein